MKEIIEVFIFPSDMKCINNLEGVE
jgi:hypothetical protein